MHLLILSGENIDFAAAEAKAVLNLKNIMLDNRLAIAKIKDIKSAHRLAFTHSLHKLIFIAKRKSIEQKIKTANLKKYYSTNFAARILTVGDVKAGYTEQQLGSFIWRNLQHSIKPKVNLSNPVTEFCFIFTKRNVYLTSQIIRLQHDFQMRKAHKRSVLHPSSLSPKLAAGMVNILNAPKNSIIMDPFVGTAGILIEASLLKYKTLGFDINKWMISAAKKNMKQYKNYSLKHADATDIKNYKNTAFICTDLPYSKNTRQVDIKSLYSRFFAVLKKAKITRAVIGVPFFPGYRNMDYSKLAKKSDLSIKNAFIFYVHKSLSKRILVIES